MITPLLAIKALTSGYGSAAVLHEVSLNVNKAEIVAVLGKNGMGKSTLLKTIMGFVRPLSGQITFAGKEVTRAAPNVMARAGLAHAPQEHTLFQDLTVEDNLRVGVISDRVFRQRLPEVEVVFPRMIERLGQRAGTLSGGEQKMLLMSRALIAHPQIMLVDEISEGLQPTMVHRMGEALTRARDELGIAVLLVEQHLDFALSVSDRVAIMKLGEIVEEGASRELAGGGRLVAHLAV
ncbi:ABC transporter ATP-binding protein [Paracoccus nototheniae]|uniref:ABC transporter ATP-binding protein n=1 Tax=Paracoccus nototheniae TaxID=2489002 RepID=A0ABW4E0K8_9RHOB|nr:ABC transporter ATP-binding protein [Paracoccus nototheniae]